MRLVHHEIPKSWCEYTYDIRITHGSFFLQKLNEICIGYVLQMCFGVGYTLHGKHSKLLTPSRCLIRNV